MHLWEQAGMRLLSEQQKAKHSEWWALEPTQHRQGMKGSWAVLALTYCWRTAWLGSASASALGTVGWYSSFVTGPAMFTEFQVSPRKVFGRRVALTSQDMKSSGEVDELSFQASWTEQEKKKAKGLVHWCRKIKFSGLGQRQGSSRLPVTSSVCQRGKK